MGGRGGEERWGLSICGCSVGYKRGKDQQGSLGLGRAGGGRGGRQRRACCISLVARFKSLVISAVNRVVDRVLLLLFGEERLARFLDSPCWHGAAPDNFSTSTVCSHLLMHLYQVL